MSIPQNHLYNYFLWSQQKSQEWNGHGALVLGWVPVVYAWEGAQEKVLLLLPGLYLFFKWTNMSRAVSLAPFTSIKHQYKTPKPSARTEVEHLPASLEEKGFFFCVFVQVKKSYFLIWTHHRYLTWPILSHTLGKAHEMCVLFPLERDLSSELFFNVSLKQLAGHFLFQCGEISGTLWKIMQDSSIIMGACIRRISDSVPPLCKVAFLHTHESAPFLRDLKGGGALNSTSKLGAWSEVFVNSKEQQIFAGTD